MTELVVDWCSYEAAKYAVEHWHYSKRMPRMKLLKIGAWENKKFIGSVIFGMGASASLGSPYGLGNMEFCELVRVALADHQHPVTEIVSKAIKMIKVQSPGLRLIISFADPHQEHVGSIYQAGNWIYSGRSSESIIYIDEYGIERHSRNVGKYNGNDKYGVKIYKISDMVGKEIRPGKFRYLYPLDRAMRRQIEPLAQPYPKSCGQSVKGDTPDDQSGDAGSIPAVRSNVTGGVPELVE